MARKQPNRLIVLDEAGFTTNMYTSRGYAPKGQRLTVYEPHGHRHTSTLVGALTTEGFIAPLVIKGALNANIFENYITKILAKEIPWCPTSVERSVGLSTPPMTRHDPSILPPWQESSAATPVLRSPEPAASAPASRNYSCTL